MTPANSQSHDTEHRERNALVRLLGDDDPVVRESVQQKILSLGPTACDWLRPLLLHDDAPVRRHARELVLHFDAQAADREFLAFCLQHGEEFSLEEGALKLARTASPDLNPEAYSALLDDFALEARRRLLFSEPPRALLTRLNRWLFEDLGFQGDRDTYFAPRNNYLNEVLNRRRGNPVGLSVVYLLIAQRLGLPVSGIGLPGHFVCRYQDAADSIYIDVFDGGRLLTKADCVQHLLHSAFGLHEQFLQPVTPRRILLRLCGNLHQSYLHLKQRPDAQRVHGYLLALQRGAGTPPA